MRLTFIQTLDGGSVAVLRTDDQQKVTIPCCFLPADAAPGSVVTIAISSEAKENSERKAQIAALQLHLQKDWTAPKGGGSTVKPE